MKALTISAAAKSPLKLFSLFSEKKGVLQIPKKDGRTFFFGVVRGFPLHGAFLQ